MKRFPLLLILALCLFKINRLTTMMINLERENPSPILGVGDSQVTAELRDWYKKTESGSDQEKALAILVEGNQLLDLGIIPDLKKLREDAKLPIFEGYEQEKIIHPLKSRDKQIKAHLHQLFLRRLQVEAAQRELHPLK